MEIFIIGFGIGIHLVCTILVVYYLDKIYTIFEKLYNERKKERMEKGEKVMGYDNNINYTLQVKNEDGNCETISLGEIQEINIEKWSKATAELKDPTAETKTAEMTFVLPKNHRRKAKRIIKKQRKLLKKLGELEPKKLSLFIYIK